MHHSTRRTAIAAAVLVSTVALGLGVSTIAADFSITTDGLAAVNTAPMPHGWFASKNVLDRTKTELRGSFSFAATECSEAPSDQAINSLRDGQFSPVLNSQGHTRAWTWSYVADLQAAQNRWYRHRHCDGTVEVHGCAASIPVTLDLVATDPKTGACRTVDSTGTCAAVSLASRLAAVQDPDVVDTDCGGGGGGGDDASCGIGPCVSACEQGCNALSPRSAQQRCKQECVCTCKLQRPASCPPADNCH